MTTSARSAPASGSGFLFHNHSNTQKEITSYDLTELSICDKRPAVPGTFARIVNLDGAASLEDASKMIELTGRFIGIHRKALAVDNNGAVEYLNRTSDYDRKANAFLKSLQRLKDNA
jgi:hypothetical protein